ncbi:YkgJ family cysteine cluster protein [Methylonatrum kenyense]|uniref:YkgJ family cysteine cluster protein n=1 Tax=Methylonatrum kenyense TaxID=455253 RepID=UPI0020BDBD51|nr:YkgJ family cysteine cluster protein [Methylonatrum kenyense]MCK8514731.1 YkgJ family cysteine cluster protein [Methylonatrum kenyense]
MQCRPVCAACCIVPSISSPIPGMPEGKPAGVPCVQLIADLRCALFGKPERPVVCGKLRPAPDLCGVDSDDAFARLWAWERETSPELVQ